MDENVPSITTTTQKIRRTYLLTYQHHHQQQQLASFNKNSSIIKGTRSRISRTKKFREEKENDDGKNKEKVNFLLSSLPFSSLSLLFPLKNDDFNKVQQNYLFWFTTFFGRLSTRLFFLLTRRYKLKKGHGDKVNSSSNTDYLIKYGER